MHHEESFFGDPRTWVAVAFLIFFGIFGRKIWTALTGLLDKHADKIRAELAEAQRLRQEAEALLADAKTRRETALADAQSLLDGAKREAANLAAAAAAEAQQAASRREKMALDRIAAAEKAAVDEVRNTAANIAADATQLVLRDTLDDVGDARLIDRAIAGLPNALLKRAS